MNNRSGNSFDAPFGIPVGGEGDNHVVRNRSAYHTCSPRLVELSDGSVDIPGSIKRSTLEIATNADKRRLHAFSWEILFCDG
jgi:hypothetical protein